MAGTKISALTAAAALGGTEEIPGVQSAANVKITATQIKTFTSASPTLVTPVLGVATGTSLTLSGELQGRAGAYGSPSFRFGASNAYLWGGYANVTLEGGDGTTIMGFTAGQISFSGLGDTFLRRTAAATLQFGAADAASPVAQTIKFQDVATGTTNTAGVNAFIDLPAGTGTGAGGNLIVRGASAGSSGSAKNAWATAFTFQANGSLSLANQLSAAGSVSSSGGSVTASTFLKSGSYTVATVPSASSSGAGARIYVSDETGGATPAFSDATNWRRYADRAIIA